MHNFLKSIVYARVAQVPSCRIGQQPK